YAFTGHIADSKINVGTRCSNDVNIISADQTRRVIKILEMPPIDVEIVAGQQASLNLRREVQIVFKTAPFLRIQLIQAKALQRVRNEPGSLHCIVANLTQAVRA